MNFGLITLALEQLDPVTTADPCDSRAASVGLGAHIHSERFDHVQRLSTRAAC
jgi:hypothetical protein